MEIDKSKLLDVCGRPLTQSLFLEIGYDTNYAVFTLKGREHKYKGFTYPSLKQMYLAHEDPVEYDFANTYLLDWGHWVRLNQNKALAVHFDKWREELELKVRSQAIRDIQEQCTNEGGSFQASKWLADRGWAKRTPGRPSKQEKENNLAIQKRIDDEFSEDIDRMGAH